MLIRWAKTEDIDQWRRLADTVANLFDSPDMANDPQFLAYIDAKIAKHEALVAVERTSGELLGAIGFSRTNNRISWFAVFERHRRRGIGKRLLQTALRQLDRTKEITVETFHSECLPGLPARALYQSAGFAEKEVYHDENGNPRCRMSLAPDEQKRGSSFHYKYPKFETRSRVENCPCCNKLPMPDGDVDIAELQYSYVTAECKAQGKLFGKCHVLIKNHYVHLEDIPPAEIAGYMQEIQAVGKALRNVTDAVKINYEFHANSLPHIHCHLFPRYLDDDFPSSPIDYRICEPSPYESEEEFQWFVDQMRKELKRLKQEETI